MRATYLDFKTCIVIKQLSVQGNWTGTPQRCKEEKVSGVKSRKSNGKRGDCTRA